MPSSGQYTVEEEIDAVVSDAVSGDRPVKNEIGMVFARSSRSIFADLGVFNCHAVH